MNATLGVLLAGAMLFGAGILIGYRLALHAFAVTARFARTGNAVAPARGAAKSDATERSQTSTSATVEMRAAMAARKRVIENGADRFMELEPRLTREQAIMRAEEALEQMGAFNLTGGIPSA